jgi:hypothetical protein
MATAGTVIHSWINFTLESQRTEFRNVFEKQWIEPIILRLINKNNELDTFLSLIDDSVVSVSSDDNDDTPSDVKLKLAKKEEQESTSKTNTKTNATSESSPNKQGYIVSDKDKRILDPIDLPFKIKLQFTPFTIDTFLDKVASVLGLVDRGVITKIMALEELDRKQYIPEMKVLHEEQQKAFEEMMNQEQDNNNDDNQQQQNNSRQEQKAPTGSNNASIRGLPDINKKVNEATSINKRKTKNSTSGSNKTLRSI